MIAVEIRNKCDDRVLSSELRVAETIGKALDGFAPDPADSAVFEVYVIGRVTPLHTASRRMDER